MEDDDFKMVEASCVGYDSDKKTAVVCETGYDDEIKIPMDKKSFEKGMLLLLKNGYIDWSDFSSSYEDEDD